MTDVRVVIYGGRDYPSGDTYNWLNRYAANAVRETLGKPDARIAVVIHGDGRGADQGGHAWGNDQHLPVLRYPANWTKLGPKAGPIRNQRAIDEGKPDVGIEFPGGRGTADMARRLERAGVPIILAKPAETAARITKQGGL